jgi:lipoprotein-releasing system ATP-binding protein
MTSVQSRPTVEPPSAAGAPPLVRVRDLCKTYRMGRVPVPVLRGVNLDIQAGEWLAVLGASGSGKSTLLHLIGGLDRPDRAPDSEGRPGGRRGGARGAGVIEFKGQPLSELSAAELNRYRQRSMGMVFQFYHLLPELTVLENVLVAAMVRHGRLGYRRASSACRARAESLLEAFGLSGRLRHRPAELSGGERQRVAIARALINEPDLLLADEPTGNLDRRTGDQILDTLASIRAQRVQTMVMVTHDEHIAARADRVVRLSDGLVEADPGRRG